MDGDECCILVTSAVYTEQRLPSSTVHGNFASSWTWLETQIEPEHCFQSQVKEVCGTM